MKKKFFLLLLSSLSLNVNAQEYTSAPAVIAAHFNQPEAILTIRGVRNYNIYSINVDSVLLVNVCDSFMNDFNEQYLLNCEYLVVCLDSSHYYDSKTDWSINTQYIIKVGVGNGIGDIRYIDIGKNVLYQADSTCLKVCSWPLLPESLKGAYLKPLDNTDPIRSISTQKP